MPGIGIISNPHAKVNRNDPEHNTLIWYVLGNRGRFEVTSTLDDLANVCRNFQERGIDHIGIVGGDGTITRTLTALLACYGEAALPRIIVLRGGTVNVLATNLGIHGQPKDILADTMDFFHSNNHLHEMPVRSLMVNGCLGFLFGTTGAVRFLEAFYANKTSAWGAGTFFGKLLLDGLSGGRLDGRFPAMAAPERMSISSSWQGSCEHRELNTPVLLAATIPKLPYGLNYFPEIAGRVDRAQALYATGTGRRLVQDIATSLISSSINPAQLPRFRFDELDIVWPGPATYTLDGEVLWAADGKASLRLGPIFRFCSPYGKISSR